MHLPPAPNGPSQTALVKRVLKVANVKPSEVNFVETHGSGTALGDAIEVTALTQVFDDGLERDNGPGAITLIVAALLL